MRKAPYQGRPFRAIAAPDGFITRPVNTHNAYHHAIGCGSTVNGRPSGRDMRRLQNVFRFHPWNNIQGFYAHGDKADGRSQKGRGYRIRSVFPWGAFHEPAKIKGGPRALLCHFAQLTGRSVCLFGLDGLDHFGGDLGRHFVVTQKLHGVHAAAAGHGSQIRGIGLKFG